MYFRFTRWLDEGPFEKTFEGVSSGVDFENLMTDSSFIKVHESANGENYQNVGITKWLKRMAAYF